MRDVREYIDIDKKDPLERGGRNRKGNLKEKLPETLKKNFERKVPSSFVVRGKKDMTG